MKTLVCQQPGELTWQCRNIPEPQQNEVLIKVKSVGICGTDIHAWSGKQPFFSYPRVLGHEICGDIAALGCGVNSWRVGQQVAVIPYVACHECSACRSGRTNCCENIAVIGVHRDGGFSEYLSVPQQNILLAEGIAPEAVALIEPFAISAHAVRRAAVQPEDAVLVVGAGPIGLGTAAIAKAHGAQVMVADTHPQRRDHVACQLDLPTLDPLATDFHDRLRDGFSGNLPQTVIDATGSPQSMNQAVDLIRHGGSIVFVGLFKGDLQFSDPEFHKKETTLMGSRNATAADFAHVGELMQRGLLRAEMLLTHRLRFDELGSTYEQEVINNPQLIKGVIEFG
ncbi:zinc-binding alcohol dehydrogenase family protein [Kluyvera sp. NPDC087067]|uniref:zinc-binding alcohol dehydrogenase family protein n=1 Tax=Kluyvera sp. NPDC087067 TaxID=3364105 RepID=UPI003816173F